MSEELNRNDMNRSVAELLGWTWVQFGQVMCWKKPDGTKTPKGQFATDANQADAAVREWCGDDEDRIFRYGFELFLVVFGRECFPGFAVSLSLCTRLTQSDPEQKITALLAAAEALKVAGGGA